MAGEGHTRNAGLSGLGRSRAGYYQRQHRTAPARDVQASAQVKAAFMASGKSDSSRRVRKALAQRGVPVGRFRVRRLMRENGLCPIWKRKFINTTDSKHDYPVAPNLLDRQFNVAQPNQAWVSDITYIRTRQGWLYLAAVMDLYSRKIIGWAIMAPTIPAELVVAALR
ncbi:Integrase core domain-containing protein [Nitrosomonas eutropha]|nr:Integrase core domain-containing protein [Nitrosomonas eutropha]